jgi:molybdopterin-synthase adenylyltransferase
MRYAAAMTADVDRLLREHLDRADGQEDVCFALWRTSCGSETSTALISDPILPLEGERQVHGNASFMGRYLARAAATAAQAGAGLVLLHSHPRGRGWQEMSRDDLDAERGSAARIAAMTGLPLVGLTLATSDGAWSARFWEKSAPRTWERRDCEIVKVVGLQLRPTYHPALRPAPAFREELTRTVSAWGSDTQGKLARLRVGVVGLGSVGSIVAETLARMGVEHIRLIDFDAIEVLNLDRVLHATADDAEAGRAKVHVSERALRQSATAANPRIDALEWSVVEEEGLRAALDCDVLFSCVDRPWPRAALNLIAYAHLVPVIDGGIVVSRTRSGAMRGADWRAHIAAPERRCLECLGQYDPGLVQSEREGRFDDPEYMAHLADEDPLRRNENVFAFSVGCAGLEIGQFLSMVVAPAGIAGLGAQMYHSTPGSLERDDRNCESRCLYSGPWLAKGDLVGITVTARHEVAENARASRHGRDVRPPRRRWLHRLLNFPAAQD